MRAVLTDPITSAAIAITGARVLPIADAHGSSVAPIEVGTLVLRGGKIAAVGADVEVPADAEVVDGSGTWLLPGFIESHAHVGVHDESLGSAGADLNEMTAPDGSRLRAIDAINPADKGFDEALRGGITSAVIKPGSGNPIGGRTVALKTWGRIVDEMLISDEVSVKSAMGENPKRIYGERKQAPSTRMGVAAVLREAFIGAQHYKAARERAAADGEIFERKLGPETLADVLDGKLVWDQHAHRADDIVTAVRLAEEFDYRLVINHGTEAHLIADYLAERDIPVIYGPLFTSRSKAELANRAMENAGVLARAGVKLALTTDHPVVPIDFLVYQAAIAVKEGLDPTTALAAMTVNPAAMLGLGDRIGALVPGYDGDVVMWSGDPLDVRQRAIRVFIRGREVYRWDDAEHVGLLADPYYRDAKHPISDATT